MMKIPYQSLFVFSNYLLLVLLSRRHAQAVFLNLFMTNPQHHADSSSSDSNSDDRRSYDHALVGGQAGADRLRSHPKDVRGGSGTDRRSSVPSGRLNDHGGSHNNCNEDRECQLGMYCDRHYGLCKPYRTAGQLCRRDAQCSIGYDCMFGRCLVTSKPGHRGARCIHDRDCLPGMCCARQHGEKICKPKLKLGQNCFVPDGGLPYWGNDMCPCDEGLLCRLTRQENDGGSSTSTISPSENTNDESSQESRSASPDDWFNLWTDHAQMRCVQS